MLQKRLGAIYSDPRINYACIFKNEGQAAGASLEHSHTQLVGMEFVPKAVLKMAKKAEAFFKLPSKQAKNVIFQNASFAAACPKASRFPNEIWIVPKEKRSSLVGMPPGEIILLAETLRRSLFALDSLTGYRPYNIVFHCAPKGIGDFPFHVEILPRVATWAGFELGTEIVMISSIPNESAKQLREIIQKMP
jgi:UDPglucose--hexose-1-phosphate uridylyltransferase